MFVFGCVLTLSSLCSALWLSPAREHIAWLQPNLCWYSFRARFVLCVHSFIRLLGSSVNVSGSFSVGSNNAQTQTIVQGGGTINFLPGSSTAAFAARLVGGTCVCRVCCYCCCRHASGDRAGNEPCVRRQSNVSHVQRRLRRAVC